MHGQARTVAEPIIATVSLMAESGLPCFSRGAPVANLRTRFHLEMSDAQARLFWGGVMGHSLRGVCRGGRNGIPAWSLQQIVT